MGVLKPGLLAFFALFLSTLIAPIASQLVERTNTHILANIRIEGANATIFEGHVFTRGHNVTTSSGGTHHCDGTNLGANPTPGPTCTSALDDASKIGHFSFDGYVYTAFPVHV